MIASSYATLQCFLEDIRRLRIMRMCGSSCSIPQKCICISWDRASLLLAGYAIDSPASPTLLYNSLSAVSRAMRCNLERDIKSWRGFTKGFISESGVQNGIQSMDRRIFEVIEGPVDVAGEKLGWDWIYVDGAKVLVSSIISTYALVIAGNGSVDNIELNLLLQTVVSGFLPLDIERSVDGSVNALVY